MITYHPISSPAGAFVAARRARLWNAPSAESPSEPPRVSAWEAEGGSLAAEPAPLVSPAWSSMRTFPMYKRKGWKS